MNPIQIKLVLEWEVYVAFFFGLRVQRCRSHQTRACGGGYTLKRVGRETQLATVSKSTYLGDPQQKLIARRLTRAKVNLIEQ
jgi:hypothetical protein